MTFATTLFSDVFEKAREIHFTPKPKEECRDVRELFINAVDGEQAPKLSLGEAVRFSVYDRKAVLIGTRVGNVVVFEPHPYPVLKYFALFPMSIREFLGVSATASLGGELSCVQLEIILGNAEIQMPNIGQRLEKLLTTKA